MTLRGMVIFLTLVTEELQYSMARSNLCIAFLDQIQSILRTRHGEASHLIMYYYCERCNDSQNRHFNDFCIFMNL